jgi:hypothetical protein
MNAHTYIQFYAICCNVAERAKDFFLSLTHSLNALLSRFVQESVFICKLHVKQYFISHSLSVKEEEEESVITETIKW